MPRRSGSLVTIGPIGPPPPTAAMQAHLDVYRWRNLVLRASIAELLLEAPHREPTLGCLCRWCKARQLLANEERDGE